MHRSIAASRAAWNGFAAFWIVGIGICASATASAEPTAADARAFVAKAEADLSADADFQNRAAWVQATYINSDTNWINAKVGADSTERPYARYFLAYIYEFQFYRAACRLAGWQGPINRCSVYRNREVGAKLNAMLQLGQSKPWPQALAAFSGEHDIDATAINDYFAPLSAWLDKQNAANACKR
jgi:hypothetical protein